MLAGLAALAFTYPRGIAYAAAVIAAWLAAAMLVRSIELYRTRRQRRRRDAETRATPPDHAAAKE